jgi:putative ABC transport system ATP-binding protein
VSISKRFGRTVALEDVSIDLAAGEVVALLGPSGSGKSTLLLCLSGILRVDVGTVHFDGVDLTGLSDGEMSGIRRRRFGFVFQSGHLVPDLSAIENVALPLRFDGVSRMDAEEQALATLDEVGVADMAAKRIEQMSGGQAQRVAVARALVAAPEVVFADEPTGSLDSLSGETVMDALVSAAKHRGATVLLVTHDMTVAAYGDRHIVLRDGRISVADGALA